MSKLIGFVGQGWIGKNYAEDFEKRGFKVVRYGLHPEYINNKKKIKDCDIVFIAVPTPTTPDGFDDKIVREAVALVGKEKIAVIKSTLVPGTTEEIQKANPDIFVIHSPEFLTTHTAQYDAANPIRNIIGLPIENDEYRTRANEILEVLPPAPYKVICSSREAEFVKYGGNCFFNFKNMFFNLFYDFVESYGCDWRVIREAIAADHRIGDEHTYVIHKGGRGAGGACLIKDFAAFEKAYKEKVGDKLGVKILESIRNKNISLLKESKKDLDLLKGVYGNKI